MSRDKRRTPFAEVRRDLEDQAKAKTVHDARRRKDYAYVLSTREGRRVMKDIFDKCFVFGTTFTGNSQTYLNEGRREVGTELFLEVVSLIRRGMVDLSTILDFLPELIGKEETDEGSKS